MSFTPPPSNPNFVPGNGARLVVDRFDFEAHLGGVNPPNANNFRHKADQIDLSPHLVIGNTTYTDAQNAIAALSDIIVNNGVSPATPGTATSNLGVITLGGDLGGTALIPRLSHLQGFALSLTSPPNTNDVLTWNGLQWVSAAASTAPSGPASGDLSGSYPNPVVSSISGTTPVTIITRELQFASSTSTPIIDQAQTATSTSGTQLTIKAQDGGSVGSQVGGILSLSSGAGTGGANPGSVQLQAGGSTKLDISGSGGINCGDAIGGVSGTPFAFQQTAPLDIHLGGTITLTGDQIATPAIQLTGTLGSNTTIVLPNASGFWIFDFTNVSFNAKTVTFQSGTGNLILDTVGGNVGKAVAIVTFGSNLITMIGVSVVT